MHISIGNRKLGPDTLVVNRPVGLTCPVSCPMHPEAEGPWARKCYQHIAEGARPNIRNAAMRNLVADVDELASALEEAGRMGRLVRVHTGGDFYHQAAGDIDWPYVQAWVQALERVSPSRLPLLLAFTHVLDGRLVEAFRPYRDRFRLMASVHDATDLQRARAVGFEHVALTSFDHAAFWRDGAWTERYGVRWLVCPEQRKKPVTCQTCRVCWERDTPVMFLEHSYTMRPGMRPRKGSGNSTRWGGSAAQRRAEG